MRCHAKYAAITPASCEVTACMALKNNLTKLSSQKRDSGWVDLPITANSHRTQGSKATTTSESRKRKKSAQTNVWSCVNP